MPNKTNNVPQVIRVASTKVPVRATPRSPAGGLHQYLVFVYPLIRAIQDGLRPGLAGHWYQARFYDKGGFWEPGDIPPALWRRVRAVQSRALRHSTPYLEFDIATEVPIYWDRFDSDDPAAYEDDGDEDEGGFNDDWELDTDGNQIRSPKRKTPEPRVWIVWDNSHMQIVAVTEYGEGLAESGIDFAARGQNRHEYLTEWVIAMPLLADRLLAAVSRQEDLLRWLSRIPYLGPRDVLLSKVASSRAAYQWAALWPDKRALVRRWVTDSDMAMGWASLWPEDRHLMRAFVVVPIYALGWARKWPEDKVFMRTRIRESIYARFWAEEFPEDRDRMRPMIKTIGDAFEWAVLWPEDKAAMLKVARKDLPTAQGGRAVQRKWIERFPEDQGAFPC